MKNLFFVCTTCTLLLLSFAAHSTHIRAGEIRAERLNCNNLSYRITVIIYTNTESPTHLGGTAGRGLLSWGEGSTQIPFLTNVTIINAALRIGRVTYIQEITFSKEGNYTISYEEAHRNVSTLNIPNGNDDINFYVENQLNVSKIFCDSSPSFLVAPVDQACKGKAFYHNPGASDHDGDSLSYSITIPKGNNGVSISGYDDPNKSRFYAGLNFQQANMDQNGPPTFSIDAITGLLTWDAPGAIGAYNIAIKVTQWKKNPADSTWIVFGYVIRDMQIEVLDCDNRPPDIAPVDDLCVLAGELVNIDILGKDPDLDDVIIEVFSDITSFPESPAKLVYAGLTQATSPDTAHILLTWTPACASVREQPYQVVVKITDSPPAGGVKLTRFRSFKIKVMGPAPVLNQVSVNPVAKKVTLQWDLYVCQNSDAIQIWRRVSKRNYAQPQCETGMQKSLKYDLISEIPGNSTTYEDGNLAIGAQYCYRIVARFGNVGSKISLDTCLIPQPAEAPVITHVTVEKTDPANGKIRVSWTPPFDIDQIQYPPPYQYKIQRGNGFSGGQWTTLTNNPIADTTYVDSTLPTSDTAFHYRVLLFVPSVATTVVDTSSTASSVKLMSTATEQNIELTWESKVPWSVFLEHPPYHYIYRSTTDIDEDFVLIDSVNVNENGLTYFDKGQYMGQNLRDHTVYYYKVETVGAYGNPGVAEPFSNYSQIIYDHLQDITPPCPPVVSVTRPDCTALPCLDNYSNTINWSFGEAGCANDVVYYELYVADSPTAPPSKWLDHVEDIEVMHTGLHDLSLCYSVIAVDWVGNKSVMSETSCGENCPVIYMPNVFTPDVSVEYNDTFHAFSATGNILNNECSRFIDFMSLTIINRWGEEIFVVSSDDVNAVVWDGRDKSGNEMATGVYYYVADVQLKYSQQKAVMKQIKGWVHLIR